MNKKRTVIIIMVILICLITGFIGGFLIGRMKDMPFVAKGDRSIGIYMGNSAFYLDSPENITNPVLTAKDVTDSPAHYVADPFMVYENGTWYMFFEVLNASTNQGDIGLAISKDGLNWSYKQIVINEPFHLSYPCVFKWKNEYYMIPESGYAFSVRLYKAIEFPTRWEVISTLLNKIYVEPSFFYHNDKCWLFFGTASCKNLYLYYADDLSGPWIKHPKSPIIKGDADIARPGGRVLVFEDRIIRFAQDCVPTYGNAVRAFEITTLTTTSYEEKEIPESPILKASGKGWNADGMHHVDPHMIAKDKWIACVDGYRDVLVFGLQY
jgi:hypothetical protein